MPTRAARKKKETVSEDAISLLKADHRHVEDLLKKFEKAKDEDTQAEIAAQICEELTAHAQVEEEIFYPAVREAMPELEDLLDEALVEHGSVKQLIADIEELEAGDPLFKARVTVLGEYVKHHVQEEEKEMMTKVKKSELDLEAMGAEILERKEELLPG